MDIHRIEPTPAEAVQRVEPKSDMRDGDQDRDEAPGKRFRRKKEDGETGPEDLVDLSEESLAALSPVKPAPPDEGARQQSPAPHAPGLDIEA